MECDPHCFRGAGREPQSCIQRVCPVLFLSGPWPPGSPLPAVGAEDGARAGCSLGNPPPLERNHLSSICSKTPLCLPGDKSKHQVSHLVSDSPLSQSRALTSTVSAHTQAPHSALQKELIITTIHISKRPDAFSDKNKFL